MEWLSEILGGMVVGFMIFLFFFYLIFINEGCVLKMVILLVEGFLFVVFFDSIYSVVLENEGRLVYIIGVLWIFKFLFDLNYGVYFLVVKLWRYVEMY